MDQAQFDELKGLISAQGKEISEINKRVADISKRLTFIEITVNSIDKKVDMLMQWTLADKDGVDYSTKSVR